MSQENMELLRGYHEKILRASQGDMDPEAMVSKMEELWDPAVEYDVSEAEMPDIAGIYRGVEACRQLWRDWYATWQTFQFEYELIDAGDRVVVLLDLNMRGRSSGVEVPFGKHAFVVTFRNGLLIQAKLYMSQAEALEAAGLRK